MSLGNVNCFIDMYTEIRKYFKLCRSMRLFKCIFCAYVINSHIQIKAQGCARFAEILQNCVVRQVLGECA